MYTRKEITKRYSSSDKGKKTRREYARKWRQTAVGRAYKKKYRQSEAYKKYRQSDNYKRIMLKSRMKSRYGITPEEYETMLESQGHTCAICGNSHTEGTNGKLYIDHCHVTGKVRGLLCMKCNSAIGKLGDDPTIIQRASEYLLKHKKEHEKAR